MYSIEKTKSINYLKQFDYTLLISILILSTFGIIILNSATKVMPNGTSGYRIVLVQIISLFIGITICLFISTVDYSSFKTIGIILYIVSVLLLILVLFIGIGDKNLGSRSWIKIPIIGGFQPSEVAKITFILMISIFLERIKEDNSPKKNIIKLLFYTTIPIALVIAESDFGNTIAFLFMFFVMIFIAGLRFRYIFIMIGTFALSLPPTWFFLLNNKRKARISVFLFPETDPSNAGFNLIRSKMAIGSGKIWGQGLYNGIQTQRAGVPVKESDFIFSVIGEELGFIGCIIIIALMLFILLRFIYIAKNSNSLYGSFIAIGIASSIAFNFIENVGMCIGLLPITGVPLPFISQGGSALISNYIAIGIMLSISMRKKRT